MAIMYKKTPSKQKAWCKNTSRLIFQLEIYVFACAFKVPKLVSLRSWDFFSSVVFIYQNLHHDAFLKCKSFFMTDTGQILFHLTNLHTVYFWLQRQWYQNPIMCIFISSFAKLNSLTSYFAFKPRPSNFVLWNCNIHTNLCQYKKCPTFSTHSPITKVLTTDLCSDQ